MLARISEVHRAAAALAAAGGLAVELSHQGVGVEASRDRMTVIPVVGHDVVVVVERPDGADGHGFLPDVQV
ncbi:hypothetical protein D3C87_2153440 [compost metagenome]